jgi:uncharacterized protein YgiM (DUF1202 family)
MFVVAFSCAMAWTVAPLTLALAQTGSESPNTLPDTKIAPPPAEESPSTAATPESQAAAPSAAAPEMAAPEMAAPEVPPPPPIHHKTATHHRPAKSVAGVSATEVEPVHARVKLKEDAWVFTRPTKWSKHVERVHADKYVEITGTTRNYLRVKLKSGQEAYLPTSAVEMTRPADKIFQLTSNAPVLSEPSHWGKKLSEVHKGHNVHVVGISLNYMKIRMKDGVEGYIPTTALE